MQLERCGRLRLNLLTTQNTDPLGRDIASKSGQGLAAIEQDFGGYNQFLAMNRSQFTFKTFVFNANLID